ncbi:MAG: hypothetical protein EGP82_00040 [Odoribacter splanchnicus]|nr:hypothetical protein [Odoribacter splanchnicus]
MSLEQNKKIGQYLLEPKVSFVWALLLIIINMLLVFLIVIKPSDYTEAIKNIEVYKVTMVDTVVSVNKGENLMALGLYLADVNRHFELVDERLNHLQGNITETFNNYRQESNNYINKVNGYISLWLGVLALIGIFTPFMINRHFENKIRDYEDKLKEAEDAVEGMKNKTDAMEAELRKKGMVEGIVAMRVFDGVLMIDKMDPERLKEIYMSMQSLDNKIELYYSKIINSDSILDVDREYIQYSIGVFKLAYRRLYHIVQDREGLELFNKLLKVFEKVIKANDDVDDKKLKGNLSFLLRMHKRCLNYIEKQHYQKKYSI